MKLLYSVVMAISMSFLFAVNVQGQTADTTVTVKVKGVTCGTDLKMMHTNIEELEGISECEIVKKGVTTVFDITFDPQVIKEKKIRTAILETGTCGDPDARPYKIKE